MARRKNEEGVEVEVPDTTIEDGPVLEAAAVEDAPVERKLSETTLAEMAEGKRIVEERAAALAVAKAAREADEAAAKPAE